VIRVRRAAVVLRMAAETVGRQRRVVVVHVATGTGNGGVSAGQRETRVVVIERCLGPGGRVMADVTLLREPDRHVVRIIGVLKVGKVAGHTCRVRQSVCIAAGMALAALQRRMPTGQRPASRGMIEARLSPRGCVVTDFALLGEAHGNVIRIGRSGVILLMAAVAGGRQAGVIVVHVALRALHAGVRASEWKRRLRVIECCRHPRGGGVADLTGLRDPGRRMVRIRRALVVLQMARYASCRGQIEVPVRVALIALQARVATG